MSNLRNRLKKALKYIYCPQCGIKIKTGYITYGRFSETEYQGHIFNAVFCKKCKDGN